MKDTGIIVMQERGWVTGATWPTQWRSQHRGC